jgi:hypothetical protein
MDQGLKDSDACSLTGNAPNMDPVADEVVKGIEQAERSFRMGEQYPNSSLVTECELIVKSFKVPSGSFAMQDLEKFAGEPIRDMSTLYYQGVSSGVFEDIQHQIRTNNILQYCYYGNIALQCLHRMKLIREEAGKIVPLESSNYPSVAGLAPFTPIEEDDLNNFQKLLMHLLNEAHRKGYRKYNGDCYRARYAGDYYTYAWERVCSLKEFIYQAGCKENNPEIWKQLTNNRSNASSAVEYLDNCRDWQLEDLVKDRHVFSFRNGVYLAHLDRFWKFGSEEKLPTTIVSAKYFDLDFDDAEVEDWYDIETPHFQSIMEHQAWPKETCKWMYVLIGRLIYQVNELDGWQVIPFLKGAAGTGKSTIALKICANLFEKADVGVLSNNIERKFGLSAFCSKYLFVAPEVKSDLQMEQAEFQSIVSGEDIQINIKHQKAESIEWRVPGVLAGNEVPSWVDNSGSVSRRTIIFAFEKMVQNGDMELGQKLEKEMANILRKCNKGYLDAVSKYAKNNIWNHLPPYFKKTRADMEEDTNALEHFLNSPKVTLGADLYCRYDTFMAAFNAYCIEHNFKKVKLTKDSVRIPFFKRGLTEAMDTRRYPPNAGEPIRGKWVIGLELSTDGYRDDFMEF